MPLMRFAMCLQVSEIGLTERTLDDFEMKRQVRGQLRLECIEQETPQLLPAGTGQT